MFSRSLLYAFVLLAPAGSANAGFFDVSLNDHAVQVWGGAHVGSDPDARVSLGGRGLYDSDRDAKLGSFYVGFGGRPGSSGIDFTAGLQALVGQREDADITAVALGAHAIVAPERWKGVFLGGRLYYAPDILAWSDAHRLTDWAIRAGYRFHTKIFVFAEYQRITVNLKTLGDTELSDDALLGFGAQF